MADSSSDSESHLRSRANRRGPLRASHLHTRPRGVGDVSEKIHKLADTLQDTSRNLKQVDEMLGQYREYNSDQTEAITSLKETLEQSIEQLRSKRLSRLSGFRSASLSSLCASDLDATTVTGNRRLHPTSPLKDYSDVGLNRRRRSRSASVRFVDEPGDPDQLHSLHQSLRDLSSDQLRINGDLSRELAHRNRTEAETKKALQELNVRLDQAQHQESVSERVERRLQQLEQELRTERQQAERRQDHLGHVSTHLQGELKKRESKSDEVEASLRDKLGKLESDKSQLKEDLERYRRRLDQTEGSREALLCQVEDLRSQILKLEEDRGHLQHQVSQMSLQSQHENLEEQRRICAAVERSEREKQELERQMIELRTQLNRSAMLSEIDDLKRSLDQRDREKVQLAEQLEALNTDMEKRERQQLRMLQQVKDIQGRYEMCEKERRQLEGQNSELGQQLEEVTQEAERCLTELRQEETLRMEAEKKKEDLKSKAQETVKHWKLKCKKLERELHKKEESESLSSERCSQAIKEKDEFKCQLQATIQQAESLRKELAEVLGRRAQQEEELHLRQMRLTELQDQQLGLEKEVRESQELVGRLQGELQRQVQLQQQLQEDRERLQEEILSAGRAQEKSNEKILELQESVSDLSAERAELSSRLAQEERSTKELRRNLCEAQKQAEFAREELSSAGRQLKMERDVHQRELTDLRSAAQTAKAKHERNIQEMLAHFRQEREELESHIRTLKAELIDSKSLVKSERQRLEKMKIECDKLSEEMLRGREESAALRCKYQLAAQDAEEQDRQLKKVEDVMQNLKEKLNSVETEQETILSAIETEINSACQTLSRNSMEKFKAMSSAAHLMGDPHYWLAETKTKLHWLCEEIKDGEDREDKLRSQMQQCREQLKELKLKKESEKEEQRRQISKLEQQLEEAHRDKKELLDKTHRRDEEMWMLQSTRMALDHLESVPEKLSLLDDMKDLNDSHLQREVMEERYAQYREIVGSLQQQLEDSKRRIQEYREEKLKADVQSARLSALSASIRGNSSFLSSSLRSDTNSPLKRGAPPSLENMKDHTLGIALSGAAS
ncbi:centrosomal protein of 128 kDa isoform X2 [Bufo gargarizans]|uniref:centrosomal protein of 128 kDa isoform X2 n=1 Tax=Bufo gargarizans TaxID=30331 RepID=UPI001CF5BC75|nr:centrosomal protein of 128 kDa isoform X2 [Bufo gargarizans]